ncbi:MAG: hypothetical protein QM776_04240 [Rhodocyclaceae bacterium]
MRLDRPGSLGKTIEAKATNRAIKIVYLVPFDDSPNTHKILDAAFFESYTRWAGVYTLFVPTNSQGFSDNGYEQWLRHYDPDFIYSYVDLDPAFVANIDHIGCPIAFLKHRRPPLDADDELNWRSFLPNFRHYIDPVSSISAVHSPIAFPHYHHDGQPKEPTVFTQFGTSPTNRFLADNFGTGFSLHHVTNPIPGLFKTLCLTPADLPTNTFAGTERCVSVLEAFRAITEHKAMSIARSAMAYSDGMPRPESANWASAFRLFVGSTALDRIHFWNSRHLGNTWSDTTNSLIVEQSLFDEDELVDQLGKYLNQNNFLGHSNGQYQVEIHSSSLSEDVLNTFRDKLKPHTWNSVRTSRNFAASAVPNKHELGRINEPSTDTTTLKLTEDSSEIAASEPAHFIYTPPHMKGLTRGQWIIELSIQRHNNLSRYSNVVDQWTLPRRRKIAAAFTDRLAKPTLSGRLALVPATERFPMRDQVIKPTIRYEIHLPSDEVFFRNLTLEYFRYPTDDMREEIPRAGYIDLAISDKGENLRGVISLFDHLSTAFEILTNRFWRAVLADAKEETARPLTFTLNKLSSHLPNDRETIQHLKQELNFISNKITSSYLQDSLKDTLEHLVRLKIFHQVAHWRCVHCGHMNSRSFDNMKIRNECDICTTEYLAPIDIEWKYELNDFVYRSVQKHHGLPVLWALGFLQLQQLGAAFWYLPEVDLYEDGDDHQSKNEIDILCVRKGKFYAVEAKRSVSMFLNKEGSVDKLVKVIKQLRPDVALLAFERYCDGADSEQAAKESLRKVAEGIRERIGPWTTLEILVAKDTPGFNDFPSNIGWSGRRSREYQK